MTPPPSSPTGDSQGVADPTASRAGRSSGEYLAAVQARVDALGPSDASVEDRAREVLAGLAVPPGSLAGLGDLAVRIAAAAGRCPPPVPHRPALLVAAGDHGVHSQGVSPWPQQVTATMVGALCRGEASASAIAAAVGAEVDVLDAGIVGAVADHPRLRRAEIRRGTGDLATGAALTSDEVLRAILVGTEAVDAAVARGADLLVLGDMGIANTTPAACLIAALTGSLPENVTGPGAAGPDADLSRKRAVVAEAVARHGVAPDDPLGALAAFGGLEHAALVGVCIAGAGARLPVVLDGVNTLAAALAAAALSPAVVDHLVAGHRSPEPGASVVMDHLGLEPLIDRGLRVGEGTGGLLAVPSVVAAARVLNEVVSLEQVTGGADEVVPADRAAGAG